VTHLEVVPDDVEAVSRCVARLASTCDFVFTSGGLGPTHDDLTMAGVAAAFGETLVEDAAFFAMLTKEQQRRHEQQCGQTRACVPSPSKRQATASMLGFRKMASVPRSARVEWPSDGNPWPMISLRNVHILAGCPAIFKEMFRRFAQDGRFEGLERWTFASLWLDVSEDLILEALQETVDKFPTVEIGSYPAEKVVDKRRLQIAFEAFDAEKLASALAFLKERLPSEYLVAEEVSDATGLQ